MKKQFNNLSTLDEFKEKNYGKRGSKERDELEAGYDVFKIYTLKEDLQNDSELNTHTFDAIRKAL